MAEGTQSKTDADRARQLATLIHNDFLDGPCVDGGLGEVYSYPSGTAEFWVETDEDPPVRMRVTVQPAVR